VIAARHRRLTAARVSAEAGFTLMEVLLALVISSAIVIPLLAWMILGYRQQTTVTVQSHDDNATNQLSIELPPDVASSALAATTGADCVGGTTVVLQLQRTADPAKRVVYAVIETTVGGQALGTLVRRECDGASPAGATEISDQLTRPASGWPGIVECTPASGQPDACRQVTVTLTGPRGRPMSVTATRRLGTP
jgi:prepilin-type N-terminal cleavage/methylation domain-containing protein